MVCPTLIWKISFNAAVPLPMEMILLTLVCGQIMYDGLEMLMELLRHRRDMLPSVLVVLVMVVFGFRQRVELLRPSAFQSSPSLKQCRTLRSGRLFTICLWPLDEQLMGVSKRWFGNTTCCSSGPTLTRWILTFHKWCYHRTTSPNISLVILERRRRVSSSGSMAVLCWHVLRLRWRVWSKALQWTKMSLRD